jgi:hypothetical protein
MTDAEYLESIRNGNEEADRRYREAVAKGNALDLDALDLESDAPQLEPNALGAPPQQPSQPPSPESA